MSEETLYNLYLERNCVRVGRGFDDLKTLPSRPTKKLPYGIKLLNRAKRVQSKLWLILSSIYPRPFWFITIIFPGLPWVKQLNESTPRKTRTLLNSLHRAFKYRFPNGYLVWTIEYLKERGVHVHYACRTKTKISKNKVHGWFTKKWHSICGFDVKNAVDVKHYDHKGREGTHDYYVSKYPKLKNKCKLINNFKGQHTFGFVNKKNIPFREPKKYILSQDEVDFVRAELINDLNKQRADILKSSLKRGKKEVKLKRLAKHRMQLKSDFFRHIGDKKLMNKVQKILDGMELKHCS